MINGLSKMMCTPLTRITVAEPDGGEAADEVIPNAQSLDIKSIFTREHRIMAEKQCMNSLR
jgi:hypothetical protein